MQIHPNHLAARNIAASETGRYAINGVKLEQDGTLVATNGRALLLVQGMNQDDGCENPVPKEGVILPDPLMAQMQKLLRGKGEHRCELLEVKRLEGPDDEPWLRFRTINGSMAFHEGRAEEGKFPDHRPIVPPIERGAVRIRFDPALLVQLLDTIRSMTAYDQRSVEMIITPGWIRKNAPLLIRADAAGGTRIAAVLMPVTVNDHSDSLTEWERAHGLEDKRECPTEGDDLTVLSHKALTKRAEAMCQEADVAYDDWELARRNGELQLRAFYKGEDGSRVVLTEAL